MKTRHAQAIRFGILAARHIMARDRMTPHQIDYLEGCHASGWIIGDFGTGKAFDQECQELLSRAALRGHAKKAAILRERWLARD